MTQPARVKTIASSITYMDRTSAGLGTCDCTTEAQHSFDKNKNEDASGSERGVYLKWSGSVLYCMLTGDLVGV